MSNTSSLPSPSLLLDFHKSELRVLIVRGTLCLGLQPQIEKYEQILHFDQRRKPRGTTFYRVLRLLFVLTKYR